MRSDQLLNSMTLKLSKETVLEMSQLDCATCLQGPMRELLDHSDHDDDDDDDGVVEDEVIQTCTNICSAISDRRRGWGRGWGA